MLTSIEKTIQGYERLCAKPNTTPRKPYDGAIIMQWVGLGEGILYILRVFANNDTP